MTTTNPPSDGVAVRLSKNEDTALRAFEYIDTEWALPFKTIGQNSGLEQRLVRRTVRALARKGVLVYRRGLWTEDGEPAGSGYSLTKEGSAFLHRLIAASDAARYALLEADESAAALARASGEAS